MDDRKIIELFQKRDEEAIRQTELKYGKLSRGIAAHILSNREDAEECVNDALLGLWNAIPPAEPEHFPAFFSKITRNLALKKYAFLNREKRSREITVSLSELEEIIPDERVSADFSGEALGKLISGFLRGEKEDARNVFIRKYFYFDSVKEIAGKYRFTESKVKNMLFHTRNRLREYLRREGVEI